MTRRLRQVLTVLAAVAAAASIAGCTTTGETAAPAGPTSGGATITTPATAATNTATSTTATPETNNPTSVALDALTVLPTRPNIPGYDRDCGPGDGCVFGPAWADSDRNGCDQRDDVLSAQLTDVTFKPGTHDCVVATGTLADPYTGKTIDFVRGPQSGRVQIDHVVPLALAWDLGASTWTAEQRESYANDTKTVLLAVDGPANEAKSDSGPAEWMPPNAAFDCSYVQRFVGVLSKYRLAVTADDKAAMTGVLTHCG